MSSWKNLPWNVLKIGSTTAPCMQTGRVWMLKYNTIEPHGASLFRSHFEKKAIPECQVLTSYVNCPSW